MDILLFLTEDNVVIVDRYQLDVGSVEQTFDWSDMDGVKEYLSNLPENIIVGVVLDFIDEVIKNQWYAKLLPWEKSALENRQVQKVYADGAAFVNFVWTQHFRKGEQGRDEQEARIVSVSKTEHLAELFKLIETENLALKAIYSNTFLIDGLFFSNLKKPLKISSSQVKQANLLIAREGSNTFRQVLLHEGRVQLTRLIEINPELEMDEAIIFSLIDEVQLVLKYIYNQKLLDYNAPVGVIYLDDDQQSRSYLLNLYKEKVVLGTWHDQCLIVGTDFEAISSKRYLNNVASSFRHAIASYVFHRTPPSFYQNTLTQKVNNLIKLRLSVFTFAVISLFFGVCFNGQMWVETSILEDTNQTLSITAVKYQQEIKQIEKAIKIQFDAEDVKQIVSFSEQVLKVKIQKTLGFDVTSFSRDILTTHPEIQITKLSWKQTGAYDNPLLIVTISGDVGPFKGVYQESMAQLDAFMDDISKIKSVRNVQLLSAPIERNLGKAFSLSGVENGVEQLPFSLSFEVSQFAKP